MFVKSKKRKKNKFFWQCLFNCKINKLCSSPGGFLSGRDMEVPFKVIFWCLWFCTAFPPPKDSRCGLTISQWINSKILGMELPNSPPVSTCVIVLVSYTHPLAYDTLRYLVFHLLFEKKNIPNFTP